MANVSIAAPEIARSTRRARTRITCIDVARIAGVAPSTISRVINDPSRVAQETRDRVLETIKATGYRPLQSASSLPRGIQGTIGLISEVEENDDSAYRTDLIKGAAFALARMGIRLAMDMVHVRSEAHAIESLPMLKSVSIDGLILDVCNIRGNIGQVADTLQFPAVFVNAPEPRSFNTIMPDDVSVARDAADYLIQRGHRRIGYIPGAEVNLHSSQSLRMNGISQALLKAQLHPMPMWDVPMVGDGYQLPDYIERVKAYRAQGCTAIITYNAPAAAYLLRACVSLGVRVPDDLSIISCDYDPMLAYSVVPITCFNLNRIEMGRMAVDMLMERVNNNSQNLPSVFMTGQLREMESVKSLQP